MNDIQHIITERVDDVPLLLEQMKRMALPTLIDQYFPAHGNWYGLSLGWVSTIWRSSIVSRGDHRLAHVEPWVANRLLTLQTATDQKVERLDFTDDRLEIVLRHFSDDSRWAQFESHLNQHTVRVYDLRTERVHVDSTTASPYASVSEEGLFQFGHSKDHRPDLPQVKVMQAVLDPLGMPLATDVVSGERADDPLYVPCIQRVQASLGRSGLLFVGDCKMAAQDTRTFIALAGDYYLCPLPQVQLAEGELDEALERVWSGAQVLSAVWREQEHGAPQLIAQGYEREVPMSVEVEGRRREWSERRLIVRSVRHADAAEVALRVRVAKAKAQVEALNRRGRGRPRFEDVETLRQAVNAIVQRHCVEDFLWLRYDHCTTIRPVRAYQRNAIAYAHGNDAALVEVQSVVIGSSGGKHTCTMTLRLSHRNETTMEWTVNGMTADQVAEKRARLILLGEPLTTGDRHADAWLFGLRGRDSIEQGVLEAVLPKLWHTYHAKPTECLRLARLQAVFALKVTNTVEHILAFTLGPMVKGGVQVHFEGCRSQGYTNRSATVIHVAGKCPLPVRV